MEEASQRPPATADLTSPDLDEIQADSEKQALPDQEKLFRVAKRVRSKLHNLPDPARPPLGFVPGRGFDVVFPFIKLPHLAPNLTFGHGGPIVRRLPAAANRRRAETDARPAGSSLCTHRMACLAKRP
jgi:hypothetical protein